jgi:D-alanyl-lipoteichoic acid acyltransferase DltB (MBOAT superfamily)
MLFNSFSFAIFLPIVFGLHWWLAGRNKQLQNGLLLAASYYFYACWDWRFVFLLLLSTLLDFIAGQKIAATNSANQRRIWFGTAIGINLGVLGLFKYFNFFADSFATAAGNLGFAVHPITLNLILPLGISFYTFHGLSYVIDVYRNKIPAEKNLVDYGLFVSFFPLLVAGPIERATHLLPQLKQARTFKYDKAVDGLRQILWGLFKKIVIADNCAVYANDIFSHSGDYNGSTLLIGAVFFAIQIYGDFSGYSDIAIGTARLFGIELLRNFAYPYFSRDIAEFWRRWHISLTTWFRDYLYIPLGGSQKGRWITIRNVVIVFLVSGFWHGANWTYIIWGLIHALCFLPLLLRRQNRVNLTIVAEGRIFPTLRELLAMLGTFGLTTLAWIFFRAESLEQGGHYVKKLLSSSFWILPSYQGMGSSVATGVLLVLFFLTEWIGREQSFAIEGIGKNFSRPARWTIYAFLLFLIGMYMPTRGTSFIYFQF